MDLDKIAARLRSREPYEATDLGFAVAREFFRPLYGAWLLCVLPLFAAAAAFAAFTGVIWAPLLALWLLKPAYDRIPLYVVSRGLFGDLPDVRRTVRYALSKLFAPDTILDCTIRRFSPFRGFLIPLRDLENLSGNRYKKRKSSLLRTDARLPAVSMLVACLAFEIVLVASGYFLVLLFAPPEFRTGTALGFDNIGGPGAFPPGIAAAAIGAYFVAVSLVEVFYVAGSFGLYINRRIHLEGWDIEIEFKRLARRLRGKTDAWGVLVAAGGAVLVATLTVAPSPSAAASGPESLPAQRDPGEVASEVLEDDKYGEMKEKWKWVRRSPQKKERSGWNLSEPLAAFGNAAAMLLELALWIVAALAVLVVLYLIIRQADLGGGGADGDGEVEAREPELQEIDRDRDLHLPPDLVEGAVRRWEEGQPVASLSILYRGTLRSLSTHYDIDIEPYMTARECVRAVRRAGGPGEYVGRLGRAWTSTAYADRPPSDETAQALFREWREHFTEEGV